MHIDKATNSTMSVVLTLKIFEKVQIVMFLKTYAHNLMCLYHYFYFLLK